MDSIIDQDEQIRREMDMKNRLQTLKLRNQEEIKKSLEKVLITKNDDKSSISKKKYDY